MKEKKGHSSGLEFNSQNLLTKLYVMTLMMPALGRWREADPCGLLALWVQGLTRNLVVKKTNQTKKPSKLPTNQTNKKSRLLGCKVTQCGKDVAKQDNSRWIPQNLHGRREPIVLFSLYTGCGTCATFPQTHIPTNKW